MMAQQVRSPRRAEEGRRVRLRSLCSGIWVIDDVWSCILGQEIAGHVEIKPSCQAVLTARWPPVPKVSDMKEITDHDPFGPVDLVAGGSPCQPFSASGKRRGTTDDRHLCPSAFALVQRRRPTWVLLENGTGIISVALDLVLASLESANYQLEPRMGGELDGLADWMDRTGWPALPEESQHLWEPPRTVARKVPHHDARLEAIGNAIVPRQIFPFLSFLVPYERGGA